MMVKCEANDCHDDFAFLRSLRDVLMLINFMVLWRIFSVLNNLLWL
jgi:hypothetical protein